MIGYIKGRVTALFKDFCFLETGGIGYRIFISDKTRQQLMTGDEAKLFTYMAVREDAILLYGFLGQEEQELFLLLISISKIGPKVAMGILSAMTPAAFVGAVKAQNVTQLTKLPGIGKKTAERLLVELKDKVGVFALGEMEMSLRGLRASMTMFLSSSERHCGSLGRAEDRGSPLGVPSFDWE